MKPVFGICSDRLSHFYATESCREYLHQEVPQEYLQVQSARGARESADLREGPEFCCVVCGAGAVVSLGWVHTGHVTRYVTVTMLLLIV